MMDILIGLACATWLIFFFAATPVGRRTLRIGMWGLGGMLVVALVIAAVAIGYYGGRNYAIEAHKIAVEAQATKEAGSVVYKEQTQEEFWASIPRECWDFRNCRCTETRKKGCWGEEVIDPLGEGITTPSPSFIH